MKSLPKSNSAQGVKFTVADFYEAGRGQLELTLLAGGKALGRIIEEPIVTRAGLALTGFYDHFAYQRLQLVGNAEVAYLESLGQEEALRRIGALIERKAFCFIFTNGYRPAEALVALAEKTGAAVLVTPLKTRVFAHHAAYWLDRLGAPRMAIYATMVEVCGIGVLVEGDPGLGKSETALGLVKRGHALVADDLTCIRKDVLSGALMGSASDSTAGFMEIRGIGIIHVPSIFGINAVRGEKRVELVITFKRLSDIIGEIDRVGMTRHYKNILGVDVPQTVIPVSEGRDLVNLVETAAQQHKLIEAGFDPVNELSERLHRRAGTAAGRST